MIVWPSLASSYDVFAFCNDSTMALASFVDRLLKRMAYDGFAAQLAKKYPPTMMATIAKIVTAFCPGVKDLKVSVMRRTGAGRRSVISGLHPHDLLEGFDGLVPDRHGQLEAEGRLGGGHRVLRRVGQPAVGDLYGQVSGLGLGGLNVLDAL